MTNEVAEREVNEGAVTQAEIDAVKQEILTATLNDPEKLADLRTKNSAVLTTMMPVMLRVMIDEAANSEARERTGDPTAEGSAADWARNLFAERLGFTLPTKGETRVKKDKRSQEIAQKANRAAVADLIDRARKGEINL